MVREAFLFGGGKGKLVNAAPFPLLPKCSPQIEGGGGEGLDSIREGRGERVRDFGVLKYGNRRYIRFRTKITYMSVDF